MKSIYLVILSLFICKSLWAVPKMMTEPLPMEERLAKELSKTEEGRKSYKFIASLLTFQDHEDESKYYYFPTYRPSNSINGAATPVINSISIEYKRELDFWLKRLDGQLADRYYSLVETKDKLYKKLSDDLTEKEQNIIRESITEIDSQIKIYEAEAQENQDLLPPYVRKSTVSYISTLFASLGFPMSQKEAGTPFIRNKNKYLVAGTNGGFLSGNLFAGFTDDEINAIRVCESPLPKGRGFQNRENPTSVAETHDR